MTPCTLAFCQALLSTVALDGTGANNNEPSLDALRESPHHVSHEAHDAHDSPAIDLSIINTSDVWRNARGGLRKGWRHIDNLDVTVTIDASRAFGWNGATIFFNGQYNNGHSLSDDLVGDFQVASNIDSGIETARLYEAWIEQRLAGDRLSLKAGLFDLNSEFDTTDSGQLFINSSHGIGTDFGQSGEAGPSIFPVTSLALRASYQPAEKWIVRAAVLDGVPGDPRHPRRTAIKLGDGDGALLVAELNYLDDRTKLGIGGWRYTAKFAEIGLAGPADEPIERRGNGGIYMFAESKLTSETGDSAQGLAGWLRVGWADDSFNPAKRYLGGGVVYTGPLPGRDEDKLGLAFGAVRFGRPYRSASALLGEPLEHSEVSIELTYRLSPAPWLTLQPDVQYIANPGGVRGRRDAIVLGLRTEIGF